MKNTLLLLICLLHLSLFSFAQPSAVDAIRSFDEKNPWPARRHTVERPLSAPTTAEYDTYGDPPQWEWVQKMGGDGQDRVNAFVEDPNGDLYITGSFSGEIAVGGNSYTSQGYEDMFVAKVDNAGAVLWMKQFPAGEREQLVGRSIDVDESGGLYLTGHFTGATMAFDTPLSTDKPRAAFLARLDGAGNTLWAIELDNYFEEQSGKKLMVLNSDELLLLMEYDDGRPLGFLSRFDTDGQQVWEDTEHFIFEDFDVYGDELFLTGGISYETTFGNTTLDPLSAYESVFIAKADLEGAYEWAVMLQNTASGYSIAKSIVATEGACYVSGLYQGEVLFGSITAPDLSASRLFISKLDDTGNFTWASFGENFVRGSLPLLTLDDQDDVLAIGHLSFFLTLEGGLGINSDKESYRLKLDKTTGEYLEVAALDGEAYAVGLTISGKVIKAGDLFGDLDLRQYNSSGPAVEWSLQSEGPSGWANNFLEGRLGLDASGNTAFIGTFQYDFPVGSTELFSRHEAGVVLKVDESGAVLWANGLAADGGRVIIEAGAVGADGSVVVAGSFSGIISTAIGIFSGNESTFIAKYDAEGDLLALYTYETSEVAGLDIGPNGDILVSGRFSNAFIIGGQPIQPIGAPDFYLAKFTPALDLIWAQVIGGESPEYFGLPSADNAGNTYFTIETYSTDFSAGAINLNLEEGDGNIVLLKFNPDGEALWAKVFGGGDPDTFQDYNCWPVAIEADDSGQVYMVGFMGADNNFGGIQLVNPLWQGTLAHQFNWFILKLDAEGDLLWATNVNHRSWVYPSFQMDYDQEGNLYLGGEFRDSIYLLDGALILKPEEPLQRYGLLAKFDTIGTLEWLKTIEGVNVRVEAIAVAEEDKLIVGGDFSGYAAFEENNTLQNYSSNVFLASTGGLSTDVKYLSSAHFSLAVSPNPFRSHFQVSLRLDEAQTVRFALYDTQGRLVQDFAPVTLPGNGEQAIDLEPLASLPRGMYFLQVKVGDIITVKKVEKM